jgi:hypothetical protein
MRLWSLHPKYLDTKGLVALWREGLLAKHVLEGKTIGYKNHPQLTRFKNSKYPVDAINLYLKFVWEEASERNYNFDVKKLDLNCRKRTLKVTNGQMQYEKKHLLKKLKQRSPDSVKGLKETKVIEPHPIFNIVEGDIEEWEITR